MEKITPTEHQNRLQYLRQVEKNKQLSMTAAKQALKTKTQEQKPLIDKIDIAKQGEATRNLIEKYGEQFKYKTTIDGHNFVSNGKYSRNRKKWLCLVNTPENPEIYKPRAFYYSESDHQIKALSGVSTQNVLLKGNSQEKTYNHYVQSGKIANPNLYKWLENMPETETTDDLGNKIDLTSLDAGFLPIKDSESRKIIKNGEDFNFSEKQVEFKNEKWNKLRDKMTKRYGAYLFLGKLAEKLRKYTEHEYDYGEDFDILVDNAVELAEADTDPVIMSEKKSYMHTIFRFRALEIKGKLNSDFNYGESIDYVVNKYFTTAIYRATKHIVDDDKYFLEMEKEGMIPDFSKKPVQEYKKGDTTIKEFDTTSKEGDNLRWAMATDKDGKISIDNIYDPIVEMDDYGTPKEKVNMGMLVYKTEDYANQVPQFVLKNGYQPENQYIDIYDYISRQYPIQKYIKQQK